MYSNKTVALILLEPAQNEIDYASKHVPLIEKHIDLNFFEIHVIGSRSGSKTLRSKFANTYLIPFHPTSAHGLGLYLGYLAYLASSFLRVVRLTPKVHGDVLISLSGHPYSGFVIAVTAKLLRRKSVIRISEPTRILVELRYGFGSLISSLVSLLEKIAFSLSDIVISNRDMTWYSFKIDKKQKLISQGVNLSLFNERVTPAFHSEAFPKLITSARLEKEKNIKRVIEAVWLISGRYPQIAYYIVGSGSEEAELHDRVAELNLDDHVHFLGFASLEAIPKLLRSCDIFVLPSLVEGLPSAVLEAMACGLPVVIGSARHGWKEWFVDGQNALLVKENPESIAAAIEKIVSNKELRDRLACSGLKYVVESHDSSKTKANFAMIVQQLLQNQQALLCRVSWQEH